jgi:hypothetical protein
VSSPERAAAHKYVVPVYDGKYTFVYEPGVTLMCLRHGEPWLGEIEKGSNAIAQLVAEHSDALADLASLRARVAEMEKERAWKCMADNKRDPPQDCDWPYCGCEPRAQEIVDELHSEHGWLAPSEVAEMEREQEHARRVFAGVLVVLEGGSAEGAKFDLTEFLPTLEKAQQVMARLGAERADRVALQDTLAKTTHFADRQREKCKSLTAELRRRNEQLDQVKRREASVSPSILEAKLIQLMEAWVDVYSDLEEIPKAERSPLVSGVIEAARQNSIGADWALMKYRDGQAAAAARIASLEEGLRRVCDRVRLLLMSHQCVEHGSAPCSDREFMRMAVNDARALLQGADGGGEVRHG